MQYDSGMSPDGRVIAVRLTLPGARSAARTYEREHNDEPEKMPNAEWEEVHDEQWAANGFDGLYTITEFKAS